MTGFVDYLHVGCSMDAAPSSPRKGVRNDSQRIRMKPAEKERSSKKR